MAPMVRKQILLDAETDSRLEALAARRGISQSELVRESLAALLDRERVDAERATAWARLEAAWLRASDKAAGTVGSTGRGWTRDDLYEG
jgi:hypothetical protein